MGTFFRNVAAVLMGWLAGVLVMLVCMTVIYAAGRFLSPAEFPLPPDPNRVPKGIGFLAASLGMDLLMALAMGYVMTWIATKPAHLTISIAAGLMVIGCVATLLTADYGKLPLWVSLARVFIAPAALFVGAMLRGMNPPSAGPRPYDIREKQMAC